jgi:hypothetical protein
MSGKLLGVMTGAALLASIGVASAGERVKLTDAQLDRVVAGEAIVAAQVGNAASGVGSFALSDNANGARTASISATFATFGTGTPSSAALTAFVQP